MRSGPSAFSLSPEMCSAAQGREIPERLRRRVSLVSKAQHLPGRRVGTSGNDEAVGVKILVGRTDRPPAGRAGGCGRRRGCGNGGDNFLHPHFRQHLDTKPLGGIPQTVDDRLGRIAYREYPSVFLYFKFHPTVAEPAHGVAAGKGIDVATPPTGNTDFLQHGLPPLQDDDSLPGVSSRPVNGAEKTGGAAANDKGGGFVPDDY